MKSRILSAAFGFTVALAFATQDAQGANAATGTGIGIQVGSPSGLSFKFPQGRQNAVHASLGYDFDGHSGPGFSDHDHLYVGADYVWYNDRVFPVRKGRLPLYYGPGGYVVVSDRSVVGLRGVLGLEYQFAGPPFDVFLEIGPRINIIPDTHGDAFGAFGARFFF